MFIQSPKEFLNNLNEKGGNPLQGLIRRLSSLKPEGMYIYLIDELKLRLPSSGSSRWAFYYKGAMLKIAFNEAGIFQNALEAKIALEDFDIVPKVYYADPKNRFLFVEKAYPGVGGHTFERLTGVKYSDFLDYAKDYYRIFIHPTQILLPKDQNAKEKSFLEYWKTQSNISSNFFVREVINLITSFGVSPGDMGGENLGVVERNGKQEVVILDPGLNAQVGDDYYASTKSRDFFDTIKGNKFDDPEDDIDKQPSVEKEEWEPENDQFEENRQKKIMSLLLGV